MTAETPFVRRTNMERLDVRADRTVRRSGIVTSADTAIVYKTRSHLVVKVPGGKGWSGRGQQSYYAAHFIVYEIVNDLTVDGVGVIRADRLFDFPVRS